MSNDNLINLLREVRPSVQFHIGLLSWSNGPSPFKTDALLATERTLASIDAALAERQDSATDEVEWHSPENRPTVSLAGLPGVDLEVQLGAERWHWDVSRYGDCATEDEAKAAAEKAAKGLR